MKKDILAIASSLSNADLLSRLLLLAERTREDTAEMVAHLAELEARQTFLAEGYGSLFSYCTIALRLSEHSAYNRVVAAHAARQFPVILEGLADGSLNLTTVRLLAPCLNADNHRDVLARAAGRSKREVEKIVAQLAPRPDVPPSIRKLPVTNQSGAPECPAGTPPLTCLANTPAPTSPTPIVETSATPTSPTPMAPTIAPTVPAFSNDQRPAPRPIVAPLSPARYRVQFTVGEETYEDLRLAQDLLRRQIPNADPGTIFARALKLLLADIAREKTAATVTPGPVRPLMPGSRRIPASVKRAVWLRDRGQCDFVAKSGRRCTERTFLEFHHVQPYATGGEPTVTNISLRCRRHNAYEADLVFGTRNAAGARAPAREAGRSSNAASAGGG